MAARSADLALGRLSLVLWLGIYPEISISTRCIHRCNAYAIEAGSALHVDAGGKAMNTFFPQISPLLPEIFIALAGLWLLLIALFSAVNPARSINMLVVVVLVAAAAMLICMGTPTRTVWNKLLIVNEYTQSVKLLVLVAAALTLTVTDDWLKLEENARFEYPLLALFSVLGMLLLSSANDLITLLSLHRAHEPAALSPCRHRPRQPAFHRGGDQIFRARIAGFRHAALWHVAGLWADGDDRF